MKKHQASLKMWFMALAVAVLAGCGGGGSSSSTDSGTLHASLTDAPSGGYDAVNVTVSKLRVHQSATATDTDGGWTDISLNPARKINLLNLTNGALEDLGQTPLVVGHYTQLRLVLVPNATGSPLSNSVILSGTTTEIALDTPSAVQSGIKLINPFDVAAGQRVDLVLDFDAGKSVVKAGASGKYLLKPVIKVVPTVLNGITGFVDTSALGSNVRVSAQQNGTVIGSTVPSSTGEFFLARLATGNYDIVLAADGRTTKVIAAVPVTSLTSVTLVSTQPAPISLPLSTTTPTTRNISGTVTLSPANLTDAATYAAAKQTFVSSSVTVTVKSQATDLSGAYLLALPIDAPFLGQYGTGTLPIAFSAQSSAAGQYKIEASITGYVTQSFAKDISAADATQDFALVQ